MLLKQHFEVDGTAFKCCLSSTMRKHMTTKMARAMRGGVKMVCVGAAAMWLASCTPMDLASYDSAAKPAPSMAGSYVEGRATEPAEKMKRAAEERPGLATGFGESIRSEWSRQSFVRASSSPAGTSVAYYNDREGFEAMAGSTERAGAMRKAAGDRVEWGIRSGMRYLPAYETYSWGSGRRRFVVGKEGDDYAIVIKNLCKSRLELVLSVDGLDVLDGKAASMSKQGYVIAPGETLEIKGWRTSPDRVSRFRFTTVSGSYANLRHGAHRNVGVMGLAVFDEKGVDPWKWMPDEVGDRFAAKPF
jgi:hypothetical protein